MFTVPGPTAGAVLVERNARIEPGLGWLMGLPYSGWWSHRIEAAEERLPQTANWPEK
ncbi:hypothetical protein CGRA01v4_10688 [Colletotrichum graminicola]|nr:hypothetical protein CGRA01v4_10688 [Colletotrichum graminicola]